jgi:type I restriction enzyme M protein
VSACPKEEADRYFAITDYSEIEENEFNLNLPRYVDTFEPEPEISLQEAVASLIAADEAREVADDNLKKLLKNLKEEC